ncbi:MAG: hypothetical protein C3F02_04125 [Parcubacteria group bacterium]|nr:MAG: hypothetical protein C3F02_04125 [Parcubacteria group bacterium]
MGNKLNKKILETYRTDIAYLEGLINMPRQEYLLGVGDRQILLERLRKFLGLLGHPENNQNFIHITGTSGKGTTANLLHQLIADSGHRVGTYTSPFSTTSLEKIQINNHLLSPADLHRILNQKIKPALDRYLRLYRFDPPSYFEIFLALALLYFRENKCDWVILEAGLGGTHDATNVIAPPKLALITNVGLDHTEILGPTKKHIARDKAGIIKPGCKFLTAEKSPTLLRIFAQRCRERKAKMLLLKNLTAPYKKSLYFSTKKQQSNLNLALNAIAALNLHPRHQTKIINNFKLSCRQEIIQKNPLVILDGAHNNDKISNLIEFVRRQKYQKLHLITGFAFSKNWSNPLKKMLKLADKVYLTHFLITTRKSANLHRLYKTTDQLAPRLPKQIFSDPWQALATALKNACRRDLILITGSFFLCGELRKKWVSEEQIIKELKI